jgi:NTP pyrophosphatase (non-canonical NTP hydrolase)
MKETKKVPMHSCVAMWLKTIGQEKPDQPQLMTGKQKELYTQITKEETDELYAAIKANDLTEICDGLFDSLWCITQLAMMYGININDLTRAGYISNMSKFCKTRQEAVDTVIAYELGNHPNKIGVAIDTVFEQVGELYVVRRTSDNKVMKSINFKEPDFSFITKRMKNVETHEESTVN